MLWPITYCSNLVSYQNLQIMINDLTNSITKQFQIEFKVIFTGLHSVDIITLLY